MAVCVCVTAKSRGPHWIGGCDELNGVADLTAANASGPIHHYYDGEKIMQQPHRNCSSTTKTLRELHFL